MEKHVSLALTNFFSMVKNLPIRLKLLFSFFLISFLFIPVSYFVLSKVSSINSAFNIVTTETIPQVEALMELKNSAVNIKILTENFSLRSNESTQAEGTHASNVKYELLARLKDLDKWLNTYKNNIDHSKDEIAKVIKTLKNQIDEVTLSALKIVELNENKALKEQILHEHEHLISAERKLTAFVANMASQELAHTQLAAATANKMAENAEEVVMICFGVSILLSILLSLLLSKMFTAPIIRLRNFAGSLHDLHDLKQIPIDSKDELGQLGKSINQMIRHLHESQGKISILNKELINTARQAGIAEIAANILHNIGNVLNSVNVSVDLLQEKIRELKPDELNALVILLQNNIGHLGPFFTEDEKGKLTIQYLSLIANVAKENQVQLLSEIQSLNKHVDQIKNVIAKQQSMSKQSAVLELVNINYIFEESISFNREKILKHHIRVEQQCDVKMEVYIDKHRVIQILINLIENSIDALTLSHIENPTIRLVASMEEGNITIKVKDNGQGISAENIDHIFTFGFTTKTQGQGFGLHGSIIAAQEIGGSLTAMSEGLNRGAEFTLKFKNGTPPTPKESHSISLNAP